MIINALTVGAVPSAINANGEAVYVDPVDTRRHDWNQEIAPQLERSFVGRVRATARSQIQGPALGPRRKSELPVRSAVSLTK